jgi:TrmH family RNA methyltransferase
MPVLVDVSTAQLLEFAQKHGLCLVAAAGGSARDYDRHDWCQPTILLLGNEGRGISEELLAACDERLRIPMQGDVESLNVSAAGAVMLFEAARQRRK